MSDEPDEKVVRLVEAAGYVLAAYDLATAGKERQAYLRELLEIDEAVKPLTELATAVNELNALMVSDGWTEFAKLLLLGQA